MSLLVPTVTSYFHTTIASYINRSKVLRRKNPTKKRERKTCFCVCKSQLIFWFFFSSKNFFSFVKKNDLSYLGVGRNWKSFYSLRVTSERERQRERQRETRGNFTHRFVCSFSEKTKRTQSEKLFFTVSFCLSLPLFKQEQTLIKDLQRKDRVFRKN